MPVVVRNDQCRGGNPGAERDELCVNLLVEALSHAVVPPRNEKVVGSIPTGGFTQTPMSRPSVLNRHSDWTFPPPEWGHQLAPALLAPGRGIRLPSTVAACLSDSATHAA